MERRSFLKFLAASPLVPASVKGKIKEGEYEPRFTKCVISECDSGTWPNKIGDQIWVYLIPRESWGIMADGRYISKRNLTVVK